MVTVRESEGEQGSPVCTCDSSSGEAAAGGSSVSLDKLLFHVRVREALSLCLKPPTNALVVILHISVKPKLRNYFVYKWLRGLLF